MRKTGFDILSVTAVAKHASTSPEVSILIAALECGGLLGPKFRVDSEAVLANQVVLGPVTIRPLLLVLLCSPLSLIRPATSLQFTLFLDFFACCRFCA